MADRNFDGIQHEKLRKILDSKFNIAHDKLEAAYGAGQLTKTQFDSLHGLLWQFYEYCFHAANLRQPAGDIIPAVNYDEIYDAAGAVVGLKSNEVIATIKVKPLALLKAMATRLTNEGFDLSDLKTRLSNEGVNI